MTLRFVLPTMAAIALTACRTSTPSDAEPLSDGYDAVRATEPREWLHKAQRRAAGACATLSDAEGPDVLRVVRDEALALYADRQAGLAVVDIVNPDEPVVLTTSAFTGEPMGVFEVGGAAIVVYQPWDRPPETIVRAVEIRRHNAGRVLGELVLEGAPRDARRAGNAIVVTRELGSGGETVRGLTVVSTFVLDENGLTKRDASVLPGSGAVVGGSPWGVAVAREAEPFFGKDRTAVTWLGIDDESGALHLGGTAVIDGVVPRWRRGTDHVVDVTEDAQVRVVACATAACPAGDLATYGALDFAEPNRPRRLSAMALARAGDAAFNFSADRLFVARPPRDPSSSDVTELAIFETTREPVLLGTVSLRGTVSSLVPRGDHLVALGWTGTIEAGRRAIVHDLDLRSTPRLVGSLSFGGDWTWSAAYDDDRALSFNPNLTLGALPMTTVRGSSGAIGAVQVLAFAPSGPRAVMESGVGRADRFLFVDGRLLSFSAEGVSVVSFPGVERVRRRWEDRATLVR